MRYETFVAEFTEFATADPAKVRAALARAAGRLSVEVLGSSYDEAHGCLTGHVLATSPQGANVRVSVGKSGDTSTTYSRRLAEIVDCTVTPVMVSGVTDYQ